MEYANNGTLKEYLKEHFDDLNWEDCDLVINLHFHYFILLYTLLVNKYLFYLLA